MSDPAASRRFVCRTCGQVHAAWAARCSSCSAFGLDAIVAPLPSPATAPPSRTRADSVPPFDEDEATPEPPRPRLMIARAPSPEPELDEPAEELVDVLPSPAVAGPVAITEIAETAFVRDPTGLAPVDYVLGGGLVEGSVVLLASPRGIGKSSLTLQVLAGLGHRCLYVSGEETLEQVRGTAGRIGALTPRLFVLCERELSKIFAHARAMRAQTIAIDSIQKMMCDEVGGRPGSPAQLKECTAQLVDYAKGKSPYAKGITTALWLIGHVTGDGDIAGPKTVEHEVDVVLELVKGVKLDGKERILRCLDKNRFGASDRTGHFELTETGLVPLDGDGWNEPL